MKYYYTKGYKYQTAKDYIFNIDLSRYLLPDWEIKLDKIPFLEYDEFSCELTVKTGYAHDGCSGPTVDDKTNMRAGGGEHDPLYQLMRCEVISRNFKPIADKQFKKTAKEDKMWWWRIWYYLKTLGKFAGFATNPKNKKKVYCVGR